MFSIGNLVIRFQVQFGINLHEWVFQRAEIARADFSFLKNSQVQINLRLKGKEAAWLLIKTRKQIAWRKCRKRSISDHAGFFSSLNLKLICTREYFRKLKLLSQKMLVQFQLFEKLTHTNELQIELETVWLPTQTPRS